MNMERPMSRAGQAHYETLTSALRAAWDEEIRMRGRVTNMKRTLLLSGPAYHAYMEWYPLWDEAVKLVGDRAAAVFAHAISARNGCVLCTLYFRRELAEAGISPEAFTPTTSEALLIRLAESMIDNRNVIAEDLWKCLEATFDAAGIVNLVAFAGMMIAVNSFNSALGVQIDTDLERFLPPIKPALTPADE
jgi:hypothetical protein